MVLLIRQSRFEKWLAIIGNINPTFSDKATSRSMLVLDHKSSSFGAGSVPSVPQGFAEKSPNNMQLFHGKMIFLCIFSISRLVY